MKGKQTPVKKNQVPQNSFLFGSRITELIGKNNWKNLFAPVDISSLVFFRILFGMIMFFEVSRYFSRNWIHKIWIEPIHHFTYFPFDFFKPFPGDGMYYLFYFMGFLSVCIIIGFFYRISMFLFWISFSYMFLLEQAKYMNHFYLIMLVSFVMIFIPAHTSASVDSKLFKKIKSETVPAWSLWLMRFMIAIPYFFGGVAKINSDWLQGQPLMIWLRKKDDLPQVVIDLFKQDWSILFMSYSGMLLDLFIVPALLFERTRKWGYFFILLFHLMNSQLFTIGIFPMFMIAATSLFFNPDWLRKIVNYLSGNGWQINSNGQTFSIPNPLNSKQKLTIALLVLWASIQVILPLRHFFVPGTVHWTEFGHRYAWHMKLRTKRGIGIYTVKDKKTGATEIINEDEYLSDRQKGKVHVRPYLIWQFCQIIKEEYAKKGKDVAVYANVRVSLNGRKYQQFIDSTVDMTSVARPIFPVDWVVPLTTPLNDRLVDETDNDDGGD